MLLRLLSVLLLLTAFAAGCSLKNYTAQTYVMTKPRVGIEKGNGNAGYLIGEPKYIEPVRKTRQVYVLEITKTLPEGEVKKIEQQVNEATSTKIDTTVHVPEAPLTTALPNHGNVNRIVIPSIEDATVPTQPAAAQATTGPAQAITYTVLKDDTLQKIAKKYYGSYGAWLKIYNANKEKIKNPNLLKPGTVITIPAAK